jgi:hypothetical protein
METLPNELLNALLVLVEASYEAMSFGPSEADDKIKEAICIAEKYTTKHENLI